MKPTIDEIRHWQERCGFSGKVSAARCLGVGVYTYKKWYYGTRSAPAVVRRLMQYIERLGKWEQITAVDEVARQAWIAGLIPSLDTEAEKLRVARFTELRNRRGKPKL